MPIKKEVILTPAETQPKEPIIPQDAQEEIQDKISTEILPTIIQPIQPVIQPIFEQNPIQFLSTSTTKGLDFITPAEKWAVETIGQTVASHNVTVYLGEKRIPLIRPQEYLIILINQQLGEIEFADNESGINTSQINFIVQGIGDQFESKGEKIYFRIIRRLRRERKNNMNVFNINPIGYIGWDKDANLSSWSVSCIYQYEADN